MAHIVGPAPAARCARCAHGSGAAKSGSAHRRRPRTTATAAAAAAGSGTAGSAPPPGLEQPLRAWLASQGGFLHPALRLVESAPCGARGVVAAGGGIDLSELEAHGPLIVSCGANDGAIACFAVRWRAGAACTRLDTLTQCCCKQHPCLSACRPQRNLSCAVLLANAALPRNWSRCDLPHFYKPRSCPRPCTSKTR